MKTYEATVEFTHRHDVLVDAENIVEATAKVRAGEYRCLDDMRPEDADYHIEEIIDIIEAPQ